ncbi:MAG TPA: hypothetical protein VNI61_10450 [Gemmatimonadales bacterium]|nr:hypothetical protein [Gemmatimonadales bacterium]
MPRAERWAGSLALLGLAAACATNSAPPGFLPTPAQAETSAYGGWIELRTGNEDGSRRVEGELLAVSTDSVWILTEQGVVALATAAVREGKLTAYRSGTGAVASWTALGTLSTISNGWFLVFTAPAWIITGVIAGHSESYAAQPSLDRFGWAGLAVFARFPPGLPRDVPLQSLRPRRP